MVQKNPLWGKKDEWGKSYCCVLLSDFRLLISVEPSIRRIAARIVDSAVHMVPGDVGRVV